MKNTVKNRLKLSGIPDQLYVVLLDRLTFPYPVYLGSEEMARWTGNIPGTLSFYDQTPGAGLFVPGGFIRQFIGTCRVNTISTFRCIIAQEANLKLHLVSSAF